MKDKIMPPLVLTIICIVVSGLLVLAYNATYVDNTGVLTDDMKKGCLTARVTARPLSHLIQRV